MNHATPHRVNRFARHAAWAFGALGLSLTPRAFPQPDATPAASINQPGTSWPDLLERSRTDASALDAIRKALEPSADPERRLELLRHVARFDRSPDPLHAGIGDAVAGVLQQPVDAGTLIAALRAMGRFQSRESVAEVIRFVRGAKDIYQSPELVEEAFATLTAQTGRTEPSARVADWEQWFQSVPNDRTAWYQTLAALHARRASKAAADAAEGDARLAGLYRRLLVTLPEKERDAVFAEMIRSESPEVCDLGFDQATRSVLNGVRAGPEVTAAAISRLADPRPSVRIEAADLLQKVDDPAITPAAVEALARESAPLPAASILRVLVKRPDPGALRDIAAWLDSVGPAFSPAVDAALALDRAGAVTDPDLIARIHDVLSSLPASRHTPGSVELLARVGGPESVLALIDANDPEVAFAAARAASNAPALLDRVLASASRRAGLFDAAVSALSRHRPSAAGFAAARTLPAPSAERAAAGLIAYAHALPTRELIVVCREEPDLAVRERFASVAARPAFVGEADAEQPDRLALALLLAETRVALRNPAAALAGLEAACLNAEPGAIDCDARTAPLRVTALAWLGRIPEAIDLSRRHAVTPEPWLDALAVASDLPHAPAIGAAVRELFSTRLTPEQLARLDAATQAQAE